MEFLDYVRIIGRRWRVVVATTLVGLLLAVAFALFSPKTYAAQSKVYVHLAAVNPASAYTSNQYVLSLMPSYSELDGSPQVLLPVIRQLQLHESVQTLAKRVTISNPTGTVYLDVDAQASSFTAAERVAAATSRQLSTVIGNLQPSTTSSKVVVGRPQPATGDIAPVSPRVALDVALGLVLGLVVGMVWVLVRNRLDTSIHDSDDLYRATGVAPLARVPGAGAATSLSAELALELPAAQLDPYRSLRTGLALASGGRLPGSIMVIGVACDDGAPVAAALARVVAHSGVRTCLVDVDLGGRATALAATGATESDPHGPGDAPGLSDVLEGRAELADAVRTWTDSGVPLAVLSAGGHADDPADLLDSTRMQHVHRVLRASFDLVVFSGAPAPLRPDGLILSRDVASTLLVVRARKTPRGALGEVAEAVAAAGATMSGLVLAERPRRLGRRARRAAGPGMVSSLAPVTGRASQPAALADPVVFDPSGARVLGQFVAPSAPAAAAFLPHHVREVKGYGPSSSLLPPRARSSRSRRSPQPVEPVDGSPAVPVSHNGLAPADSLKA